MATQKLAQLKAVEVSYVPAGAMKQEFLVVKEDTVSKPNLGAIETLLKKEGVLGELPEAVKKALDAVLKADGMSEKGKAAVGTAMKVLYAAKGEIPEDTMKALMTAAGYGEDEPDSEEAADPDATDPVAPGAGGGTAPAKPTKEETPSPAAPAAPTDAKKDDPTCKDGAMPMMKEDGSLNLDGVPEAARAPLQALWKEKAASDARVAKAEADVKVERDLRITKEFCDKAAVLKHVGMKPDELGPVLKEISEKAPAAFKKLEPLLKSLDERVAKGALFGEIGTTASPTHGAGGAGTEAESAIEKIAKSIVAKDEKGLTHSQSIAKAWSDNPALYTQHREEVAARRRA